MRPSSSTSKGDPLYTSRFVYVPPSDLNVGEVRTSPKYTQAEMDGWVRRLEEVDALLAGGADASTFERLRQHPHGSWERQLWDTYYHFYAPESHTRVRATWVRGELRVDDGRHRASRAQALGAGRIPVEVWVPDERVATQIGRRYREVPVGRDTNRHRQRDSRHRPNQRERR